MFTQIGAGEAFTVGDALSVLGPGAAVGSTGEIDSVTVAPTVIDGAAGWLNGG